MSRRRDIGFLVVGAGGGGTSLIAALLDSHPSLDVALETHTATLLDAESSPQERLRRFKADCRRSATCSDAPIWGYKLTTEQIHALGENTGVEPLGLFFGAFEEVPVVFILRDGRSCVESKVRRAGRSYEEAARRWRFSVEACRFLSARQEALTITFEDLVTDTLDTLHEVCAFLGIPLDERMLRGTTSPKLIKEYRRERVEADRAAVPTLPSDTLETIRADLRACGYL